ncbi:hypothetical protein QBC38DRAFT_267623 [Podospora fimiseda]|uniref:Extracellular membrane protein CFEM domain-containing protein n=1 Tax=Podospora fimiseda TaxID=252190 RepID=A0AAN7BL71_9PEZI|nr:hypothetical protein QBC38DRAFT_267623 [Podospora fimiseda]
MLLQRMAFKPLVVLLTTWTALILSPANAQQTPTNNISEEILNFVPSCAQDCFQSFISSNFDSRICGNSPSLQCLCRQVGRSQYTIGEGAVSCIVGESQLGSCQGRDATSDATSIAYNMCVGVSRAAPKTHSTLTATLLFPATGTGPLVAPTPSKTGSATTTATETSSSSATITSVTTTGPTSTESLNPIPTSAPVEEGRPELTRGQITGIVLGVVAVIALGVALIFLARCIRRKRYSDLEKSNGFAKIDESGNNRPISAMGPQISGPLAQLPAARNPVDNRWYPDPNNPMVLKQGVPPPAPTHLPIASQFIDSRWYPDPNNPMAMRKGSELRAQSTQGAQPVGLAISSPLAPSTVVNGLPSAPSPSARNRVPNVVVSPPAPVLQPPVNAVKPNQSPPKPTLTLAIPTSKTPTIIRAPVRRTDSVVTEFAEDGEVETATTGVWRPPPSDPQSATALFFADKGGNWVMRSAATQKQEATTSSNKRLPPMPQQQQQQQQPGVLKVPASPAQVELPSPEHKTRAERAQEASSSLSHDVMVSPLRLPLKQGGLSKLGSPITFNDRRREPQVSRRNPAARSPQAAELANPTPITARPPPDVFFSAGPQGGRDLTRVGSRSRRRSMTKRNRRISTDSSTSIESGAAAPFEDEAIIEEEPQEGLSPVAQSPNTPISPGKSPVSYPRIPRRNEPQPPVPNRYSNGSSELFLPKGHRYNVWHPGMQGGSGSAATPKQTGPPQQQQMVGPRRPLLSPRQVRTGSPEIRSGAPPTIEEQYFRSQKRLSNPASYWYPPPSAQQQQRRISVQPQQPQPQRLRTPQPLQQQHPRRYPTPQQTPQPRQPRPRPVQEQQFDPHPGQLYHPPPSRRQSLSQDQYLPQQQQQQQYRAYQPPSPPVTQTNTPLSEQSSSSSLLAKRRGADRAAALQLGKGGNVNEAYRQKKWEREAGGNGSGNVAPPITPGWVPELTPRKRGGDLILDVR